MVQPSARPSARPSAQSVQPKFGDVSSSHNAAHSLLNLLLSFLLRQPALGLLVQVTGQLLLVRPPLLLRRHLILSGTNEHNWVTGARCSVPTLKHSTPTCRIKMCDTVFTWREKNNHKKKKHKANKTQMKTTTTTTVSLQCGVVGFIFFGFVWMNQLSWWGFKERCEYLPFPVAGRVQRHSHS